MSRLVIAGILLTVLCLGLAVPIVRWSLVAYLQGADRDPPTAWVDLGPVPGAEGRYPPQGMTFVAGQLIFSEHWQDKKSMLYRVDPGGMKLLASAEMPPEAVHTSGLGWDGEHLFAVDYRSNLIYKLDLERTFASGKAVVVQQWPTGLEAASAMAVFRFNKIYHFAVSDFLHTGKTYVISREEMVQLGAKGLPELALVTYRNGGFSQGLTWDGHLLYEAVNSHGKDRIEVIDIAEALGKRDSSLVRKLGSFTAPDGMVEDLGNDGTRLWTSDEGSYRFFRLDSLDQIRRSFLAGRSR